MASAQSKPLALFKEAGQVGSLAAPEQVAASLHVVSERQTKLLAAGRISQLLLQQLPEDGLKRDG